MKSKKTIISIFLVFILLVLTVLTGCGGDDMRSEKELEKFSKIIDEKNFDNLSLTIYYISPYIFTYAPLSVDDLINMKDVKKITISGSELEEHLDLFTQLDKGDLISVKKESRINARVYYIFETVNESKILDVAMWGDKSSVFVNGLEVENNDIFYDIIMPFLSEEETEEFVTYSGR